MKTLTLIQDSPEWHAHRNTHFNASDAPAMLGESPYKTRNELLREKATGISAGIDATTQRRFDDGHRFEALARPLAEKIIGEDLYPVTGSEGLYSASFDGLTMMQDVAFEHKMLNDGIRAVEHIADLGLHYRIQMEHQLMVSGASRCLFMATQWDDDDHLVEEKHFWYEPDHDLRQLIIRGWEQFAKDLAEHKHREIAERPAADVSIELPALFVHAKGEITTSNMKEYGAALATKLSEVRAIELVTDKDFSNAKEAAKLFREQIGKLKLAKEAMLSQTVTIGEAARMIDAWSEDLRVTALQLEKDVEREDLAKKRAMTMDAAVKWREHIDALEQETKPIRLTVAQPDFAASIKGKRNYSSMQDAVDTALANGKVSADAEAKHIRAKLAWFGEYAKGYEALFADLQQIIYKAEDDFDLLVETRINAHKQVESEKLEAERQRIRQEEEAKAQAKVDDESKERQSAAQSAAETRPAALESEQVNPSPVAVTEPIKIDEAQKSAPGTPRPTDAQIIGVLAVHFGVSEQTVRGWISDMNLLVAA